MNNVLTNFENFSQPSQQVGEPDHPIHKVLFSGKAIRELVIIWVSSHLFKVRIVHHFFFLDSLICKECSKKF